MGMPGWWWRLRDSQRALGCEISLPGDMSWLCWDFLTVCTLPKGLVVSLVTQRLGCPQIPLLSCSSGLGFHWSTRRLMRMALVGPQGIWVWGGCSAPACARSSCDSLRAAETFPSKAGCDTCGPWYLYWRIQPADRGLCFALCFVQGRHGATCPGQPNPVFVGATASPWGLTSTQAWLDIATLWM